MFGLAQREKSTYEHYLLLPEGDRRELIEGKLLMTPAVPERWSVGPMSQTVEAYLRGEQDFVGGSVERIVSSLLLGFEMDPARVLR